MKMKSFLTFVSVLVMSFSAFVASGGLSFVGTGSASQASIRLNGKIAGISGQISAIVEADVIGNGLTGLCQNRGGRIAPGQNAVSVSGTYSDSDLADRNGNYFYNIHIDLTNLVDARDLGCPNGNWDVVSIQGIFYLELRAIVVGEGTADTMYFQCDNSNLSTGQSIPCTELASLP